MNPTAGFKSVSPLPKLSTEVAPYREGTALYTKKQSGIPSVEPVTFSRGVARRDSDFFAWVKASIEGGEYRTDLEIWHFHRVDPQGITGVPSRTYRLLECFASDVKVAGDMNADTSDISVEELTVNFEELAVVTKIGA